MTRPRWSRPPIAYVCFAQPLTLREPVWRVVPRHSGSDPRQPSWSSIRAPLLGYGECLDYGGVLAVKYCRLRLAAQAPGFEPTIPVTPAATPARAEGAQSPAVVVEECGDGLVASLCEARFRRVAMTPRILRGSVSPRPRLPPVRQGCGGPPCRRDWSSEGSRARRSSRPWRPSPFSPSC